jgi:glycosyltransferase involved in cell wall biosynthesis
VEKKLSIILPVYNERESLSLMIKILNSTLEFKNEIIIVYDNEDDNSIPVAKKLQKQFNNIILVHNKFGTGVKFAIKAGIEKSQFDNILITAVDEIFPVLSVDRMLTMLVNENYDFVSGTRYSKGGKRLGGSLIGHFFSFCKQGGQLWCIFVIFPFSIKITSNGTIQFFIQKDEDGVFITKSNASNCGVNFLPIIPSLMSSLLVNTFVLKIF